MKKATRDAVEILKNLDAGDFRAEYLIAEEMLKMEIGRQIHAARTAKKMSQKKLASELGMKETDIDAIEMADYDRDLLVAVQRIAPVLGMKVDVILIPGPKPSKNKGKKRSSGMRSAHPPG